MEFQILFKFRHECIQKGNLSVSDMAVSHLCSDFDLAGLMMNRSETSLENYLD